MEKKTLFVTIVIQVACLSLIVFALSSFPIMNVQADQDFQVFTPEPFLGSIFYGQEVVWKVFDHELPNNTGAIPYAIGDKLSKNGNCQVHLLN